MSCLFIGLFLSCDRVSDPGTVGQISVLAALIANAQQQRILVYRTIDAFQEFSEGVSRTGDESAYLPFFVENASVHISDIAGNSFSLTVRVDSGGANEVTRSYAPDSSFSVVPGATYFLTVECPEVGVSGETKVPGDFEISEPLPNSRLRAEGSFVTPKVAWSRSLGGRAYVLDITISGLFLNGTRITESRSYWTTDTTWSQAIETSVSFPDSCRIRVTAYDQQYYMHRFEGHNRAGLRSEYGYFGSGVMKEVQVDVE